MEVKPDYGLHFLRQGYRRTLHYYFSRIPVARLMFISTAHCVLEVDVVWHDKEYSLLFDMTESHVREISKVAPLEAQRQLADVLSSTRGFPRCLELQNPVSISIEAKLGDLRIHRGTETVPFEVRRVFIPTLEPGTRKGQGPRDRDSPALDPTYRKAV